MSQFKIAFQSIPWEESRPGVRQKVHCDGGRQIRLVEFLSGEGFDHWCEEGHIGYVLEGGLEIDFNGDVVTFAAGDGLFIPSGSASRHRSPAITPGTRLLMIEDL